MARLLAQYRALDAPYKLFVDLLLSGHTAEQAVKAVRPTILKARLVGEMWHGRQDVQAALRERVGNDASRSLVKLAEVDRTIEAIAEYDWLDFYDEDPLTGALTAKRLSAIGRDKRKAIAAVIKNEQGVPINFQFVDRGPYLTLKLKRNGGLIEKHEHTGANGEPIKTQDVSLTDEELGKRVAFLLARAMARREKTVSTQDSQPSLPDQQTPDSYSNKQEL